MCLASDSRVVIRIIAGEYSLLPYQSQLSSSHSALITVSATLCSSVYPTARRGGKHRPKHRPRLLPEKPLCRCRPVRVRAQDVVHRREACALPGGCRVPRSTWFLSERYQLRPSTLELERWNSSASVATSTFSVFCSARFNAPPGSKSGVRIRSASVRSGVPCRIGLNQPT
jgi:hypothetical protein